MDQVSFATMLIAKLFAAVVEPNVTVPLDAACVMPPEPIVSVPVTPPLVMVVAPVAPELMLMPTIDWLPPSVTVEVGLVPSKLIVSEAPGTLEPPFHAPNWLQPPVALELAVPFHV